MTPRKRKAWRKEIEEMGVTVYLFERPGTSAIYREVRTEDGQQDRKSLGHGDRQLAEQQARELARRIAELRFAGQTGALTLGQLVALYLRHKGPLLSAQRRKAVEGVTRLLETHFGRTTAIEDLSPHLVEAYVAVRRSGALKSPRHRVPDPGVRTGTIRNELHLLRAMTRWAQGFRLNGRRLLTIDPLAGVEIPHEKNMRRPVATPERYEQLLAVAPRVDPRGRFRCILALARHTGRRINAICELRASDFLRTREQLLGALGAAGLDLAFADHWPNGAIRWSEANDKLGFEAVAPLSKDARAELDLYLRSSGARVGDVPLFPASMDGGRPIAKSHADWWLRRATALAELSRVDRGAYHMFRRLWASERRHLPAQDVALAGGWRSIQVMRDSYQQATADAVLSAIENTETEAKKPNPSPGRNEAKA